MAMPSGSEMLLIFGVVVLLFGSKKIPELAKGLGQGIRSFKNELKDEPPHPPVPEKIDPAYQQPVAASPAKEENPRA